MNVPLLTLSWVLPLVGALLLLFIGIHNVWDTVYYQVFVRMRKEGD